MGENLPIEHMKILLKSFSIAYITQISSELCRECGENNIAFTIESAGKIEIIILSIWYNKIDKKVSKGVKICKIIFPLER